MMMMMMRSRQRGGICYLKAVDRRREGGYELLEAAGRVVTSYRRAEMRLPSLPEAAGRVGTTCRSCRRAAGARGAGEQSLQVLLQLLVELAIRTWRSSQGLEVLLASRASKQGWRCSCSCSLPGASKQGLDRPGAEELREQRSGLELAWSRGRRRSRGAIWSLGLEERCGWAAIWSLGLERSPPGASERARRVTWEEGIGSELGGGDRSEVSSEKGRIPPLELHEEALRQ